MSEAQGEKFILPKEDPKRLEENWRRGLWYLIGELANFINRKPDICYQLYYDFFGATMDYFNLWQNSEELQKMKSRIFTGGAVLQNEAAGITPELVRLQPMKGMKVLEIGGPFAQVFHLLGAEEAMAIDPFIEKWPYSPKRDGYLAIPKRFDPNNPPKAIKEKLFDLVFSRQVLAMGSGFVDLREISDERVLNFFSACGKLTKSGGLNIHNGDLIEERYRGEEESGLQRIATIPVINTTTVIFKKI